MFQKSLLKNFIKSFNTPNSSESVDKIDNMVYKLYGLSSDEVKIIGELHG